MSRNPYHRDNEPPTLRPSVLVFMDILGYSAFIKQAHERGNQSDALKAIHQALSSGRRWIDAEEMRAQVSEPNKRDPYALKAFTDNIVIGWPIHDDAEHELGNTIDMLSGFQMQLTLDGFFVRGAISIGECYVDEVAVFGDALLDAHYGESKTARDPRVILTDTAVSAAKQHLEYYPDRYHSPYTRLLLRDADDQWFVNYLQCVLINEEEYGAYNQPLLQHKAVVEGMLALHKKNPPIWSKFAWVAAYHNFFCESYPHQFGDKHKIDVELFRASPGLILET